MNIRDALFKLFWTMLNAALAAAVVWAGDLDVAWGAIILAAAQFASSWVRQKVEAKPVA